MIRKVSDDNKINFLNKDVESDVKNVEKITKSKSIDETILEQKSKHLNCKDNGFQTSRHISSAAVGNITDNGGSSKFIKSESSPTIFNTNKIENVTECSKEKTIREKADIASNKREAEQKRMDDIVASLKETDLNKGSSVLRNGLMSGENYKAPKNAISIFDTKEFERLPDKTEGEIVSDVNKSNRNKVDESWRGGSKSSGSKEIMDNLFNSLFK